MAAALALMAIGQAAGVIGTLRQNAVNKKLSKLNVGRLRDEARTIQAQARFDVDFNRTQQQHQRGVMQAGFAGRGIRTDAGSPAHQLLTQLRMDELNNTRAIYEADLQADDLRFQAKTGKIAAKSQREQAIFSMFGSLASGAGQMAAIA